MPRSPSTAKKSSRKAGAERAGSSGPRISAAGKHLVIVESPAKAKTINRYLGPDFVVQASIGHVRDLPAKAPKGSKQPVPGVDLKHHFKPTYEVMPDKKKVVTELKRAAKAAADVWFATDLDREGEAIAWHLAQEMDIPADKAKRVTFDAITKAEIQKAFDNPRPINVDMVDAQQARRILDRIVGYQVSPLLWKKVARGLSAGRVQSVAARLVVEREREIRAFVPDEQWRVTVRLATDEHSTGPLGQAWREFVTALDEKGRPPTQKAQNAWLADHKAIRAELVELGGVKFELGTNADAPRDLLPEAAKVAAAVGLANIKTHSKRDPKGKGPAANIRTLEGDVDPSARYRVKAIETKRTTSRPQAPFITSTLQMAGASALGMGSQRVMRTAQSLYEGVEVRGEGLVGLITYMRTDSTHLAPEAIESARAYIGKHYGAKYLPAKGNVYESSNKSAQEAHEAIRPTDVSRHPDALQNSLTPEQYKLYRLIWSRFVACQMTPAEWDATAVTLERSDKPTGAVLRATGRVLVFDGFYKASGVPGSDDLTLPPMTERQILAPFSISPEQTFTSPPPRYSEASLIKVLEAEGIGRPSTYASIIQVIQDRQYVEQIDRRFHATDLGEVVTDKLIEGFPQLMDLGYTRQMEGELDKIAEREVNWVEMLENFYKPFAKALDEAHDTMTHAKAVLEPAPYKCPKCGSRTSYRFGKNGRFLSCSTYPDCDYAAPINREGQPVLPTRVNVACPEDGSQMVLRTGRFGKFLASVNYPQVKAVVNLDKKECIKYPSPPPLVTELKCEKCEKPMNLRTGKRGPWLGCSGFPKCRGRLAWNKVDDDVRKHLEAALEQHDKANPQIEIRTLDGRVIPNGTPIADLLVPGGVATLEIHPDAVREQSEAA